MLAGQIADVLLADGVQIMIEPSVIDWGNGIKTKPIPKKKGQGAIGRNKHGLFGRILQEYASKNVKTLGPRGKKTDGTPTTKGFTPPVKKNNPSAAVGVPPTPPPTPSNDANDEKDDGSNQCDDAQQMDEVPRPAHQGLPVAGRRSMLTVFY